MANVKFVHEQYGLNGVLGHKTAMRVLARTLGSLNRRTVTEVLRLLAAVCLVPPNGHSLALEAMTSLSLARSGGGFRFTPLVHLLQASNNVTLHVRRLYNIHAPRPPSHSHLSLAVP